MRAVRGMACVFVFGFPKNARSNIDKDEEEALKRLASYLLSLSAPGLIQHDMQVLKWGLEVVA